jgi:UDP-N-acetylglucosamine 2-epimerase (non-hydrolysing)
MKITIVLGTRPEIIKFSPIIRESERVGLAFSILHTGQHYSYYMDQVFFEQLKLPTPKYNLDVGSGSHGEQTGKMLIGIEKILQKEQPDMVLVEGDTNTVLAGTLAAVKLGMTVGHLEAGLRSYDRRMPEEINRILVDHSADYLFAPTEKTKNILLHEGIIKDRIFVTGNTIVDAIFQNLEISKRKKQILQDLGLTRGNYVVVTVHRPENVDHKKRFRSIIEGLERVQKEFDLEIIYPIHPRAKKQLNNFGITLKSIRLIEPLDYLSFLQLENNAKLVLTDSGGIQEEACILGVPCVTLRDTTERPETVEVGSNILTGSVPEKIIIGVQKMLDGKNRWINPFGDGKSAKRIVRILNRLYKQNIEYLE